MYVREGGLLLFSLFCFTTPLYQGERIMSEVIARFIMQTCHPDKYMPTIGDYYDDASYREQDRQFAQWKRERRQKDMMPENPEYQWDFMEFLAYCEKQAQQA